MKIEKTEIEFIKDIVKEYKTIYREIENIKQRILSSEKELSELKELLKSKKEEEFQIISRISERNSCKGNDVLNFLINLEEFKNI